MRNSVQNPEKRNELSKAEKQLLEFFHEHPGYARQLVERAYLELCNIALPLKEAENALSMLDLAITAWDLETEGRVAA